MSAERKFKDIVEWLLLSGQFPTPTKINMMRQKLGKQNNLNSDQARWRIEVMKEYGCVKLPSGRWTL